METPLIQPLVVEAEYARTSGITQQTLYESETVQRGPGPIFPPPEPGFFEEAAPTYIFPPITRTPLRDVLVRNRSNLLTGPDAIIRHGLLHLPEEMPPEEFYSRLEISEDFSQAGWESHDPFNVDYLPEAGIFTDGTSFNYAHWMTEVLPRVAAFRKDRSLADVPLLIDGALHANIMRSLEIIAGPDAQIHRLPYLHAVRVGVGHNVSPAGYIPFTRRARTDKGLAHGSFSARVLSDMVDQLRRGVGSAVDQQSRLKLFIRRNSTLRHVVNEAEVAEKLEAKGFTIVEPDRMTFDEQVAVFSQARMVVGATGAAITNLLFCRQDCPVIVIMPRFPYTAYWYWRNMASAVGGQVMHVTGERLAPPDEDPYRPQAIHTDFRVEVDDVLDAVAAAETNAASG